MTRAHAIFLATQRMQLITLLASEDGADDSSDSGIRYSHVAELYDELSTIESSLDGIPAEQFALLMGSQSPSRDIGPPHHTISIAAVLGMLSGLKCAVVSIAGQINNGLPRRSS